MDLINNKLFEHIQKNKFYDEENLLLEISNLKEKLSETLSYEQQIKLQQICNLFNKLYSIQKDNFSTLFIEILKLLK